MSVPWIVAFSLLWVVVIAVAAVVVGLLRRVGDTLDQVGHELASHQLGARVGSIVPAFEFTTRDGAAVSSEDVLQDRALLLFLRAGCAACGPLAAGLHGVSDRVADVPFALVLRDSRESDELQLPNSMRVLYDPDGNVGAAFGNRATPQAYLVDSRRRVVDRRIVGSLDDLVSMVTTRRKEVGEHVRGGLPGAVEQQDEMRRESGLLARAD